MSSNSHAHSASWRPLALMLVVAGCLLVIFFRVLPYGVRGANFVPAGAMLLFAGARLRPRALLLLPFVPLLATDFYFFFVDQSPFPFLNYVSYAIYAAAGWLFLRKTESPFPIGMVAVAASLQFFLITNFSVWLQHAIDPELYSSQPLRYPATWSGLMQCYEKGIPFYRGTFFSDLLFTGVFFAAHSLLARVCFPQERIAAAVGEVES